MIIYLPSKWCKVAEMSLSWVAESLNVSSSEMEKKGVLFFYLNSHKLETTLT